MRTYRSLSGGAPVRDADRRAVVACSGGADSTALVLAIGTLKPRPVVAHCVHDMRPAALAAADRDAVARLAGLLGLPFREVSIPTADQPGNAEANARHARYRALAEIAKDERTHWVLTGHHADDQLETVLMRLLRGAGARGLGGIPPVRGLAPDIRLARPMLGVTHDECLALCREFGIEPCEDSTNDDTTRLRAAIRHGVGPALREITPSSAARVARTADNARDAADAIDAIALELWSAHATRAPDGIWTLPRGALADRPRAIVVAVLDRAHRVIAGTAKLDARRAAQLRRIADAIADGTGGSRTFRAGGIRIVLSAFTLCIGLPDD